MALPILTLLAVFLVLTACTSPETTRMRAGGPGADVGNRGQTVEMHEGSKPYDKTPQIIPRQPTPKAAAQADQASRK
jgi:hypothetical protein